MLEKGDPQKFQFEKISNGWGPIAKPLPFNLSPNTAFCVSRYPNKKNQNQKAVLKIEAPHWWKGDMNQPMHYKLRSIKRGKFRLANFASNFKQKFYFHFLIH